MKSRFFLWIGLMLPFSLAFAYPKWDRAFSASPSGTIRTLLAHPLAPQTILGASDHQISETTDETTWQTLWSLAGANQKIHRLLSFSERPEKVFVLTGRSIYQGNLLTQKFSEVFRAKGSRQERIHDFSIFPGDPSNWFVGTSSGLYESDNAGRTWLPLPVPTGGQVTAIRFAGDQMFLLGPERIHRTSDFSHFETVLDLSSSSFADFSAEDAPDLEEISGTPENVSRIHDFVSHESSRLWLGTDRGVFESRDHGKTWASLPQTGLFNLRVKHLKHSPTTGKLYAGTPGGVFSFDFLNQKWESLFQGMENQNVLDLTVLRGDPPALLAVTESGISKMPLTIDTVTIEAPWIADQEKSTLFQSLLRLEPSPRDLHELLIRYNDLNNSKIKRWHLGSRLRALLPDFSFGRDYSESNNIDLDRGSTSDADVYITGPEDLSVGWDWGVDWDLGDLIYSSAQTSIDNRGKLMVDMRRDLLGEATRIYFERRRLQMEAVFSPAASEQLHLERLMRIDELTALLDGMTGGAYGKAVETASRERPEIRTLWVYSFYNAD